MDDVDRDNGNDEASDGRVQPVGQALRATFGADNHDTLGSDLTGLMIDLSRVPFDAADRIEPPRGVVALPPKPPVHAPPVSGGSRTGWFNRLFRQR